MGSAKELIRSETLGVLRMLETIKAHQVRQA